MVVEILLEFTFLPCYVIVYLETIHQYLGIWKMRFHFLVNPEWLLELHNYCSLLCAFTIGRNSLMKLFKFKYLLENNH